MSRCPFATWRPVKNASGPGSPNAGKVTRKLGLILHRQQGLNSPFGWFCNPASQASSTFWVGKDGRLEQFVDTDYRAWAQGPGNYDYASVETEGYVTEPLTPAQIKTLAQLYAWGHRVDGWATALAEKPGDSGFGWHGMGAAAGVTAWGHPACPGDPARNQRAAVLALLKAPAPRPTVTPQAVTPKETPLPLVLYAHRGTTDAITAFDWSQRHSKGYVTCDLDDVRKQAAAGARVLAVGGPACADLAGVHGVEPVKGATAEQTATFLAAVTA